MCVVSSTIGAVATAVSAVVSGAVGIASTVATNNSVEAQYEYEKKINERNAKIAEMNATNERQLGIEEARKTRLETRQKVGRQMAVMASNGIDVTSGSALDVIEGTTQAGELDALMIKYNSEKSAQIYENQGSNFALQNTFLKTAQKNNKLSGSLDLINSGLTLAKNKYEKV